MHQWLTIVFSTRQAIASNFASFYCLQDGRSSSSLVRVWWSHDCDLRTQKLKGGDKSRLYSKLIDSWSYKVAPPLSVFLSFSFTHTHTGMPIHMHTHTTNNNKYLEVFKSTSLGRKFLSTRKQFALSKMPVRSEQTFLHPKSSIRGKGIFSVVNQERNAR